MLDIKRSAIAAASLWAAQVVGHGHVDTIIINGVGYEGYDAPSWYDSPDVHTVIGWTESATDNGFVAPDAYQGPDIICHRNATPALGHATISAGDKVFLHWNTWPDSHKGPVIDYLARCSGLCEEVDKTELDFFKIDDGSFIDMSETNGYWATDVLIADNFGWLVQIPADLEPGNYVLRHEIIALHSAGQVDGAQNYPQCINLEIQGTGTWLPSGTPGESLYHESDPGILFNLYTSPITYVQPGPTLPSGLSSTILQSQSTATANSTATVGSGGSGSGSGSGSSTTTAPTTLHTSSPATTTAKPTTTSTGSSGGGVAQEYGQCGGQGWTGATVCVAGCTCQEQNSYYSQCLA